MMKAKPLDAVPEETATPAAAPATPERVTSDVPKTKPATAKNPGRVASGKRLAERNRLALEAKKQAEAQKPTTSTTTDATNNATNSTEQSSDNTGYFILGIGGLIVSGLGVYYQREAIMRTLGRSQKPQNLVYIRTMNTNTVFRFLGWASLTYFWLEANCMFFNAIADAINQHNEQIRQKAIEEVNESESESDSEDESEVVVETTVTKTISKS